MEFDDYESLPAASIRIHMIAGAVAGIMEHCVMFPVDSVKTRMQSLAPSPEAAYRNIREGLVKMVNAEGIMRPMGGVNAVILGAGPAHALYFSAYEGIKKKFSSNNSFQNHLVHGGAGCGATLLHDSIMVPADVIKQRMQMYNSPYRTCFQCTRRLYQTEGIGVFYRSYTTQVAMNLPFHAIHIMTYEKLQNMFNTERDYNPKVHILAGGGAGAVAAALTTPLDVCKTVLNTQETSTLAQLQQSRIVGLSGAIRTIYLLNGMSGFFKGLNARVLYQMPGTAISWSVYELFKYHLFKKQTNTCSTPSTHRGGDLFKDSVIKDSIIESDSSSKISHDGEGNIVFQEKFLSLGSTNKTVERLILTASCTAADDSWRGK